VPGLKTNERPGTRAVLRHCRMSASKARAVLDLIRGQDADRAAEILRDTPREAAQIVGKLLASAVANAVHNDGEDAEELYVSACYADEGVTLKRWRPRARGRATRIRKRSCHITVIVSRMPDERLARRRAERQAAGAQRQRRVAESRRRADLAGRLSRRRHAADARAELETESPPEVEIGEAEPIEEGQTPAATDAPAAPGEVAQTEEDLEVTEPADAAVVDPAGEADGDAGGHGGLPEGESEKGE